MIPFSRQLFSFWFSHFLSTFMPMILVTGGTGLVGIHVLYQLVERHQSVRALKRESSRLDVVKQVFNHYSSSGDDLFNRIEWVDGDILDVFTLEEAMEGITHVYHCAAYVSFDKKMAARLDKVNVEGTANVVNACLDEGVQKLCHVSSTAAIGRAKSGEHITEKNAWKNSKANSRYAISKYGAEREVWRGTQEGLDAVIVNPSIILGPSDWNNSSSAMFKTASNGVKFYVSGINAFVDVRDVARAMINLMESDIINERYLVIAENMKYGDLLGKVCESMNKPKPSIHLGAFALELGWRVLRFASWFTGKSPMVTKESARSMRSEYFYSNEKLKEAIDFEFTSIEAACENAGKFYLNANGL